MSLMLIADDHQSLLNILSAAAKKEGFEVATAMDGQEALSLFEQLHPQIVLLDAMNLRIHVLSSNSLPKIREYTSVPIKEPRQFLPQSIPRLKVLLQSYTTESGKYAGSPELQILPTLFPRMFLHFPLIHFPSR